MTAAGFVDVETWLHEEPTPMEPGEPLETFLATVVLRSHLARMPEAGRTGFVRRVAERLPSTVIDYVRLNILALRR
jgi:trans-aconitate 2-methyltransferase